MKLYRMPRVMPKMSWAKMTGFKKADFIPNTGFTMRKRRKPSIKKMLRNV